MQSKPKIDKNFDNAFVRYPDAIRNRYLLVMLHEITWGNLNGDPDQNNRPRTDTSTGNSITSSVSTKSHIRCEAGIIKGNTTGFKMYIESGEILNKKDGEALLAVCGSADAAEQKAYMKKHPDKTRDPLAFMCKNYWDIRTFGGVMTKFSQNKEGVRANVCGPVQVSTGVSVSPVNVVDLSITRKCVATEEEAQSTFGDQYAIPYGLYVTTINIDPVFALRDTGFNQEDLNLLLDSITHLYEHDKSTARTDAYVRRLFEFKHDSIYGNAPNYELLQRIQIRPKVEPDQVRKFEDYEVSVDLTDMPEGVSFRQIL